MIGQHIGWTKFLVKIHKDYAYGYKPMETRFEMFCVHYLASNIFTLSRVYARVYALVIKSFITDKVGRCTLYNAEQK